MRAAKKHHGLRQRLRAFPRDLVVADMFTGACTFLKVMDAVVERLKDRISGRGGGAHCNLAGLAVFSSSALG